MVKKLKSKHPVCAKCSSWSHQTEACNWRGNCSKCNEVHIQDLCSFKKFLVCSLSTGNNCCLMSLQDIPVCNSSIKARVMFDNGSEITLVSNSFAKKNNLPFERATYTMAAMGSKPTTYDSSKNGRIYTVPLVDSKGEIVFVKAHSVESILTEKTGRNQVKLSHDDFPRLSKEVLQEAAKPLPSKYVDVLIGNPHLALQPVCQSGFGCQDCAKGRCLYRSRFGSGYVPLGYFGENCSLATGIKHVALNKFYPPQKPFNEDSIIIEKKAVKISKSALSAGSRKLSKNSSVTGSKNVSPLSESSSAAGTKKLSKDSSVTVTKKASVPVVLKKKQSSSSEDRSNEEASKKASASSKPATVAKTAPVKANKKESSSSKDSSDEETVPKKNSVPSKPTTVTIKASAPVSRNTSVRGSSKASTSAGSHPRLAPVLASVAPPVPALEGNISVLAPSQCVFTRGYSPLCVPVLAPPITVAPWLYYSCVWPRTHCILPAITPILLHRVNI